MAKIKVTIGFIQEDHQGKEIELKVITEEELSEEILESIDDCESNLLKVAYVGMRSAMSAQMSYVSKKKVMRQQEKKRKEK